MKNNLEDKLNDFLSDNEINDNVVDNKKRVIKTDYTIIERVDKIFLTENGKQLLREQY